MKKRLVALALVLFSTITLASCNQNNKKITFEKYSASQAEATFTAQVNKFPATIKADYTGDYTCETTSYIEVTSTSQYEDNEDSKSVNKESNSNSSIIKVDFDNEIRTVSNKNSEVSSQKSKSTNENNTKKSNKESLIEKDGSKYITISKSDRTYSTSQTYEFDEIYIFDSSTVLSAITGNTVSSLKDAKVSYYIDDNVYTLVAEYSDDNNDNNINTEITKKEISQIILEETKIIVKTELSSIKTTTTEDNHIYTVEEYENRQIIVTFEELDLEFFDYEDYKCLDEEDK